MTPLQAQKSFRPFFFMLLAVDFLVQLASSAEIGEFQPLISIWTGPLDDIFYGMAGLQALYWLIDPEGLTRNERLMSTTATVKRIATLLGEDWYRRAHLPQAFFTGCARATAILGQGLVLTVVAWGLASSLGLDALLLVLQRQLSYVLPVGLVGGLALLGANGSRPQRTWKMAMLAGFGALVLSIVMDGRWAHHVHHLIASLSSLQAWGAALCWIASCASVPTTALLVPSESGELGPRPQAYDGNLDEERG